MQRYYQMRVVCMWKVKIKYLVIPLIIKWITRYLKIIYLFFVALLWNFYPAIVIEQYI
jgi:hypothetical protein